MDAPWGNEDTENLIEIFKKYNVKVTFFVVGEWVDKYPESVKALSDAGHEIMNHSNTHPHMPQLSIEKMTEEINACNDKIEKITGKRPTLFRAPYGDYDNNLIDVLSSLNMYCIQWDV
ncbi:MAG: polysaccharide deacetylase family protein, partial [Acutalibacteraceae bacterium]